MGLAVVACILLAGCTSGPRDRDRPRDGDEASPGPAPPLGSQPPSPPAGTPPPPAVPTTPPPPPGKLHRSVLADGVERRFVVHVPAGVDGAVRVPAVWMLHGSGGTGDEFYNRSGWVEKADREGLIAVFPTALTHCYGEDDDGDGNVSGREYRVGTKWAAGKLGTSAMPLCPDALVAQFPASRQAEIETRVVKDDVAFFDAMVAALSAEFPLDPKRLYVTGFSNGASMSGRLLVERANTFAAFALSSGGITVDGLAARPAAVWFSVGTIDPGFTAQAGVSQLPLDAAVFDLPVIGGIRDTLAANARVTTAGPGLETREVGGETIATFRFANSTVGASNALVMVVIGGATHQYPNGSNHPMVAANVVWTFFQAHPLP